MHEGNTPKLSPILTAQELEEWRQAGRLLRLLDVRTPAEFEAAHISGAYNVPLDTLGEHGHEIARHVEEPVVLVCRSGSRARQAEMALRGSGMDNVHVLDGGVQGWEAQGYALRRGRPRWSLERQVRLTAGLMVLAGALGGALVWAPLFALSGLVGAGLSVSALTDTCTMGLLLARLPYNRTAGCDVSEMVARLKAGAPAQQVRI
jgi:rhodanese-related sulfurtransferase